MNTVDVYFRKEQAQTIDTTNYEYNFILTPPIENVVGLQVVEVDLKEPIYQPTPANVFWQFHYAVFPNPAASGNQKQWQLFEKKYTHEELATAIAGLYNNKTINDNNWIQIGGVQNVQVPDIQDCAAGTPTTRRLLTSTTPHGLSVGERVTIMNSNPNVNSQIHGTVEVVSTPTTTTFEIFAPRFNNITFSGQVYYAIYPSEFAIFNVEWLAHENRYLLQMLDKNGDTPLRFEIATATSPNLLAALGLSSGLKSATAINYIRSDGSWARNSFGILSDLVPANFASDRDGPIEIHSILGATMGELKRNVSATDNDLLASIPVPGDSSNGKVTLRLEEQDVDFHMVTQTQLNQINFYFTKGGLRIDPGDFMIRVRLKTLDPLSHMNTVERTRMFPTGN